MAWQGFQQIDFSQQIVLTIKTVLLGSSIRFKDIIGQSSHLQKAIVLLLLSLIHLFLSLTYFAYFSDPSLEELKVFSNISKILKLFFLSAKLYNFFRLDQFLCIAIEKMTLIKKFSFFI